MRLLRSQCIAFSVLWLISPLSWGLPNLGAGKMLAGSGEFTTTQATFNGGATTDNADYQASLMVNSGVTVKLQGSIQVDPADVGKQADLLVVIGVEPKEPFDGGVDTVYRASDEFGESATVDLYNLPSVWLPQLAAHPFKRNVTLTSEVAVDIGAPQLSAGKNQNYIFVGYRLSDNSVVYPAMPIMVMTTGMTEPVKPPVNTGALPDLISYQFTSQQSKTLPGKSAEKLDGYAVCDGNIAEADQLGRLAVVALFSQNWCYTDGRYNNNNYQVEQGSVSDGKNQFDAYRIYEPTSKATEFLGSQHVVYYRFPTQEDYTVYQINGNEVNKVAQVAAAKIDTTQFVKIDTLTVSKISNSTVYMFVPSSQRISSFTELATNTEGARINRTALGDVLKYRYAIDGKVFDTKSDFDYSPNTHDNVYGLTRQFFPVAKSNGQLGIVWQNKQNFAVNITWLATELNAQETMSLASGVDSDLAAATTDGEGNIYFLTIQRGDGTEGGIDVARTATLYKYSVSGQALAQQTLDTSKENLNIVTFGDSNSASLQYLDGKLGLIVSRQMHKADDGLNHQGAIAVVFDSNTLKMLKNFGQTSGHSFENVLTTSITGEFIGIDLGDNYPRGINLHKFDATQLNSQVVYTFKTQHGTTPASPAGVTYPAYPEISTGTTQYYQWSNDNRTYTELGGVIGAAFGYTIVFAGEATPDGKALDNSKVGEYLNDPRNIGLIQVKHNFENFAGTEWNEVPDGLANTQGMTETGGFYTFGGKWSKQRNTGVVWLTHYQDKTQENVSRLKTVKLDNGNLLLLWEKWTPTKYVNTYAMLVSEVGTPLGEAVELGTQVRLNRRDDVWQAGNQVYIVAGNQAEQKLELVVLKLTQ